MFGTKILCGSNCGKNSAVQSAYAVGRKMFIEYNIHLFIICIEVKFERKKNLTISSFGFYWIIYLNLVANTLRLL